MVLQIAQTLKAVGYRLTERTDYITESPFSCTEDTYKHLIALKLFTWPEPSSSSTGLSPTNLKALN